MVVSMVTGYLLCWMPYGVVAMLASFGRPGLVPPAASLIPSLLAKTSTVLNPVIYVLLNNQVTAPPCKYTQFLHTETSEDYQVNFFLLNDDLFNSKQEGHVRFHKTFARPQKKFCHGKS